MVSFVAYIIINSFFCGSKSGLMRSLVLVQLRIGRRKRLDKSGQITK